MSTEIEKTLEFAKILGAGACDVILTEGKSLSLTAQQGKIDSQKVSSSRLIGVRIIRNHRTGICYSEDTSDDALRSMVESALRLTRYSEPDENQDISVSGPEFIDRDETTYRPDETPVEEKIRLSLALESEVRRREGRTQAVPYNGYAEGESHVYYGNHLGLRTYERERSYSCYTSALLREGENQALFYRGRNARTFRELDGEAAIEDTLHLTRILLRAKPVPTGTYDVIFDTDAWHSLLGCFTGLLSAKSVKEGYSAFADSIGKGVAHPEFTLRDRPRFERGFQRGWTDAEGVKKEDLTLIERGVLSSFYHNTATARYFGVHTTGHASRSPKGQLGTALTQLVLDPGSTSTSDLYRGTVLKIFALDGLHAGINTSSGAFSLAASGELLEQGESVAGVKGITLSGNFFQLIQNITAMGNQLKHSDDLGFFSPEIRFGSLQVAGT
jgi:PmbA protein